MNFHPKCLMLRAFVEVHKKMSDADYWKVLGEIFNYVECNSANTGIWLKLLKSPRPGREHLMDYDERTALAALPGEFTVWRGASPEYKVGMSWTLDREKAMWFAEHRWTGARVFQTVVKKTNVLAHFLSRDESEIVVDPRELDIVASQV